MARYKVSVTVYKDPAGKTMMGPTALHFLGDLCSGLGLMGVLGVILAIMDREKYGPRVLVTFLVMAVAGFGLMVVLHKQAKKSAETKFLQALAQQKGKTTERRD